jgi:cytochrome c553
MADWKSGNRKFGATMIAMAKVITDAEVKEAADYFAALSAPIVRTAYQVRTCVAEVGYTLRLLLEIANCD